MKVAPINKSIFVLNSTESDNFLSGSIKFSIESFKSDSVKAENFARRIFILGLEFWTTSTTSYAIFSPSLSQSNQRIRRSDLLNILYINKNFNYFYVANSSRLLTICKLSFLINFTISILYKSSVSFSSHLVLFLKS